MHKRRQRLGTAGGRAAARTSMYTIVHSKSQEDNIIENGSERNVVYCGFKARRRQMSVCAESERVKRIC